MGTVIVDCAVNLRQGFGPGLLETVYEVALPEGARRNLEAVGWEGPLKDREISADTGYFSEENLEACRGEQVDAYVPAPKSLQRDPRFADARRHRRSVDKHKQPYKSKKRWFNPEDFAWDHESNTLVCPAGKQLYVRSRRCEIKGEFFTSCQAPKRAGCGCRLRSQCLRSKKTTARQVYIHLGRSPRCCHSGLTLFLPGGISTCQTFAMKCAVSTGSPCSP